MCVVNKICSVVASSLDCSEEENGRQEEKKRKIDHAKEAQLAHQKMCKKAMDTMNNVNDLLAKVNTYLDKSKKKARRKPCLCSVFILSYLTGLINVHLTHFDH